MFSKTTRIVFWLFVLRKAAQARNQVRTYIFSIGRLYRLESTGMLCFVGFLDQVDHHYYKGI